MTWTPEREKMLAVLWTQGLTCSLIAKALNKLPGPPMTRMAVIGKRVRLGLPDRCAPTRAYRTGERGPVKNHLVKRPKPKPAQAAPIAYSSTRGAERGNWNLRFADAMGEHVCMRFVADESGVDGFVCGTPTHGGSWCEACRGSVFQPLKLAAA